MTELWAGFECGHLGWPAPDGHDLLIDTRHTPTTDMRAHYEQAMAAGVGTFRDGLPWRHNPGERLRAAPPGATVVWDLCHFDPPPDPTLHAGRCAAAFHRVAPPLILAVNEPSLWPLLCGRSREEAVATAVRMMDRFAVSRPDAVFHTCDPFHHLGEEDFAATDTLVASGRISVIGVNLYPQHATVPLADVLVAVSARYGLPVVVTETGWHQDHPTPGPLPYPGVETRQDWLAHVRDEVARSGVPVAGVCWYPWLDMPPWGSPGVAERWPCGGSALRVAP